MKIKFKSSHHTSWGKCRVLGSCVGYNSKGVQMQKHKETIFYLGKLRIIFLFNNRLIPY